MFGACKPVLFHPWKCLESMPAGLSGVISRFIMVNLATNKIVYRRTNFGLGQATNWSYSVLVAVYYTLIALVLSKLTTPADLPTGVIGLLMICSPG